jgi:hypothetical protein
MEVLSGTSTALQMLQSGNLSTPTWSTATWPSTTSINQILYSSANNTVTGLATNNSSVMVTSAGGVPSFSTLLPNINIGTPTVGVLTNCTGLPLSTGITGILGLSNGGTNKALTASNGGIVWTDADSMEVLAGTATSGQLLRSGSSATPSWSTTTYPATNAINTLLYASSANVMSALTTANNGVLVTSNTGVPSILAGPGTSGRTILSQTASDPIWSTGQVITQVVSRIFTANGTYTPTTGMVYCIAEVVGGGGGGGGAATSGAVSAALGGTAGAGGYSREVLTSATVGASQAVTIGAAGTAGAAGNNAGGSGGTTSLGALLSATGGTGGAGGASASSGVYPGSAGGTGSGGDFNTTGNAGSPGFTNALLVMGGNGGSSFFGGGGVGRTTAGAGNAATSYGGGGSGGATSNSAQQAGGAGQPGIIVITEFISV